MASQGGMWVATVVAACVVLLSIQQVAEASYVIDGSKCTPVKGKYWASVCGGSAVTADGFTFEPDLYFGNKRRWATNATIEGAGEYAPIYQRECVDDNPFNATVPVENGYYKLTVYNAEIYWTKATKCPRRMSICGEGVLLYNEVCLWESGINKPIKNEFFFYVDDGAINLDLFSQQDDAKIAGLLVQQLDCPTGNLSTGAQQSSLCPANGGVPAKNRSPAPDAADAGNKTTAPPTKVPATKPAAPGSKEPATSPAPGTKEPPTKTPAEKTPAPGNGTGNGTGAPAPGTGGADGTGTKASAKPRSLPTINGKPITTTVSQKPDGTSEPSLIAADGTFFPTADTKAENGKVSATANFPTAVNAKSVELTGDFVKGETVSVEVAPAKSKDVPITAATKSLSVPVTASNASSVKVSLPEKAKSKIDTVQLIGDVPTTDVTALFGYDQPSNTLRQYATSASDSAGTPGGLNGVALNVTQMPDGKTWKPSGTGSRSITLMYDEKVNPTQLLLTGALDPKANFSAEVVDVDGNPTKVFEGAGKGPGLFAIPINLPDKKDVSTVKLTTDNPAGLGLDAASLVGTPSPNCPTCNAAMGTMNTPTAPDGSGAAGQESATKGSYGVSAIPSEGDVPEDALKGTDAPEIVGKPDGKAFVFPADAAASATGDKTAWVAAEYENPVSAKAVDVLGRAVAPGVLSVSVVDEDNKIHYVGAKDLPNVGGDISWSNLTLPSHVDKKVKKVLLSANPPTSYEIDAVELEGSSKKKKKHKRFTIDGSRNKAIAVLVSCLLVGGAILCCCCYAIYALFYKNGRRSGLSKDTAV